MTGQPHFGIPDPGRPSGTFAALERTTPIVQAADDGTPTTTSMRVANGTNNEHRAVLQLIGDNLADFEEFGGVAFEMQPFDTAGGTQTRRVAILNEEHATLLLTYMRNNPIVKDFKKRLVHEFSALRRAVAQSPEEQMALGLLAAQKMLAAKDERIAELEPKADFYDDLMDADGCYSFGATAKALGWGRNTMLKQLKQFGVLQSNRMPYQRYAHHFKVVPQTFTRNGETVCTATTYVLPSGLEFLRKKLANAGELVES